MAKLLTPVNFGSFSLSHRVVVLVPAPPQPRVPLSSARDGASGGMVVRTFLTEPATLTLHHAAEWRRLNEAVRGTGGTSLGRIPYAGVSTPTLEPTVDGQAASCQGTAVLARTAGFDGVELDATRHLPDQPVGALLDAMQILIDVWGADSVGVRLAPFAWMASPDDDHAAAAYRPLLRALSDMEIAFVHVAGTVALERGDLSVSLLGHALRTAFPGMLLASGAYTPAVAIEAVERRWADAVGFTLTARDGDHLIRDVLAASGGRLEQ